MNKCLNCDKDTTNAKFCCRSCSVTYNNKSEHWRKKHGILKTKNNCLSCGTEVESKYCSIKCQMIYQSNQKLLSGTASSKTLKRYLLEKHGNKCWSCGITEWNNKSIVMELEHNDGNSENNDLSNLSLICPNCHSQTPTYKGANKGNGRHYRRVRYAQGKSY
jgi:Zn finger protein HypA/HybF involved in hydrogenase expression